MAKVWNSHRAKYFGTNSKIGPKLHIFVPYWKSKIHIQSMNKHGPLRSLMLMWCSSKFCCLFMFARARCLRCFVLAFCCMVIPMANINDISHWLIFLCMAHKPLPGKGLIEWVCNNYIPNRTKTGFGKTTSTWWWSMPPSRHGWKQPWVFTITK